MTRAHKKRMLKHLLEQEEAMKERGPTLELGILCIPCTRTNFTTDQETGYNQIESAVLTMCRDILLETASKLYETANRLCSATGVEFVIIPPDQINEMVSRATATNYLGAGLLELDKDGTVKRIVPEEAVNARLSGKRTDH